MRSDLVWCAHHLTSASTKLYLLGHELVFCRHHPASPGIYRQSLLTRNTQKNGIEILMGQAVFKFMDQKSQNIVLINNSRTTRPT